MVGNPAWYAVGAELFPEKAKKKKRRVHIEETFPRSAHEEGEDVESGEMEDPPSRQDECGSQTVMSIDFKSLTSEEVDSLRHMLRTRSQYHYDKTLNTIFSAKCKGAVVDGDCCAECQRLDKNDSLRKRERFVSVFRSAACHRLEVGLFLKTCYSMVSNISSHQTNAENGLKPEKSLHHHCI
jgi:hypothetical protein